MVPAEDEEVIFGGSSPPSAFLCESHHRLSYIVERKVGGLQLRRKRVYQSSDIVLTKRCSTTAATAHKRNRLRHGKG